ncbi:hypothetical protein D9613_001486 [Agrocybe pediades]|uniref:Uncharacterized protein n=1 Tax=Agrocybe pediades TaxID=84607 RepID=A0A8H4R7D4_9AGAR|nr:hypothetical protein D9613_001486 [Agrocybe pediades]
MPYNTIITIDNVTENTTLQVVSFDSTQGDYFITPADVNSSVGPKTFMLMSSGAAVGTQGFVEYRLGDSKTTYTLTFGCHMGQENKVQITNSDEWKVDYNKTGDLTAVLIYLGCGRDVPDSETKDSSTVASAPTAPAALNDLFMDRTSTITVLNKSPNATLLFDSHDNVHGKWDPAAGNVLSGGSNTFRLSDKTGFYGSEGWVKYRVLVGSQPVKTVTISFACPTVADNWMTADASDGWKINNYNKNGALFGTFEYVHQG